MEARLESIPKFQKDSEQIKSNDMILSLKQSLRDLYLSLAETRTKYTKDHPVVVNYENMIAKAKGLMQGEMERVFSSETVSVDPIYKDYTSKLATAYIELATNEYQDAALRRLQVRYEGELAGSPEKSSRLAELGLDLTINEQVYSALQKYLNQLEIAEAMAISNVTLVQPAVVPDRSDAKHRHPSLLLNTIIALFLGTMFGVGAGFVAEYVDDTVRSPGDVEAIPGCSVLGAITELGKGEAIIAPAEGIGPARESFTALRAAFHAATRENPVRCVAVVSPEAGEGKSLVAGNLAAALAREGRSVLLVDANLRRPLLHTLFGLPAAGGIAGILTGQAEADSLPVPSGIESLRIVPAGPSTANPLQIVDSPKFRQYLARACGAFEYVVVDTPALLRASEAAPLAAWAGSVVLVVRTGATPNDALRKSAALLNKAGVRVVGVVLNRDHAAA
jgi:capsular exopolysaccharide synthesis family protein